MKNKLPKPAAASLATLAALTLLTGMASSAANAGEISLFEGGNFGGRVVTLRATAPSVSNVGFNDRTSSIVVRSGRWEVCSDDNFKGDCAIFEPGQYANLDGRFDKRVSSAREVETVGAGQQQQAPVTVGTVDLFGQPNFRGRSARIDRDMNNFSTMNFNDRTASLVVEGGTWEMCTDADYRGTCRTFGPGRYPSLGYGMEKAISSARPVVREQAPPVVHGGGWHRDHRDRDRDHERDRDAAEQQSSIVLFTNDGIRGRSIAVASDIPDLAAVNFNDMAQSMVIENGFWEFCSDSYYRGTCRVAGPGQYQRMEPALYRSVSSIRAASRDPRNDGRDAAARGDVELFTGANFTGTRYPIRQDMSTFNQGGFNDKIGSVIVNAGQWQMCVDADYRGSCTVFGPGRYAGLGGLTNQLSSIRRID
jgi:hypothetical protein